MPQEKTQIRAMAGLTLKSNISKNLSHITPPCLDYIKRCALLSLQDKEEFIRNTAGTIITTIVTSLELSSWPDLIPQLLNLTNSTDLPVVEVAQIFFLVIFRYKSTCRVRFTQFKRSARILANCYLPMQACNWTCYFQGLLKVSTLPTRK
jgi:hypothetical protein